MLSLTRVMNSVGVAEHARFYIRVTCLPSGEESWLKETHKFDEWRIVEIEFISHFTNPLRHLLTDKIINVKLKYTLKLINNIQIALLSSWEFLTFFLILKTRRNSIKKDNSVNLQFRSIGHFESVCRGKIKDIKYETTSNKK